MSRKEYIIVRRDESALHSWVRDASSYALIVAVIGTGWLLDSSAMQWVGAFIAFIVLVARGFGLEEKSRFDIDGARKRIDEIEAKNK